VLDNHWFDHREQAMTADPVEILEDLLKRNGYDVNLRENETDRYFLFDLITEPDDLALAWSQFPAHDEIRVRAAQVDAVSDIVPGWGYRTPRKSNRCSDTELIGHVREHLGAIHPLISEDYEEVRVFIENGCDIQVLGKDVGAPPDATENLLFGALYEAISDFKIDHYSFDMPILEILYDWAIYLTKCNEVALYLLWPVLKDVDAINPNTPVPGFRLWQYNCRTNYWINENDVSSGVVFIQPPWSP
jgi:hypothetical protein